MLRSFFVLAFLVLQLLSSSHEAFAQPPTPAETQRVEAARRIVAQAVADAPAQRDSFDGLLALRQRVEPVRNDLRELVGELQQRLSAVQARLAELGAPPAGTEEPASQAFDRRRQQSHASELEAGLKEARAVLAQAERTWDDLTDQRRRLFASRILDHQESFVSPAFWGRFFGEGLPQMSRRSGRKIDEIARGIDERHGWPVLGGLALLSALTAALLVWGHRWMARQRAANAPETAVRPTQGAIVARAALIMGMRALPFIAIGALIWFAVSRFDIVPDDVETFLLGLSAALIAFGFGNGAVLAAFAPRSPAYRVIRTDDATAARAVRIMNVLLLIYLAGLTIHGIEQMLSVLLIVTVATTGLTAAAVVAAAAAMLLRSKSTVGDAPAVGLMAAPMHLLRPIVWLLAAVILGALAFGYISLAGFLVGRALATAVILCMAMLAYVAIETVFHDAIAPGAPGNARLSSALGLRPETVDLVGTIIAGTLRVLLVLFTVLLLFSPWGIEFGNKNPFDDLFFGVRFGDLRSVIGAAGIAAVLFGVGLLATRLFVSWLDQRLLPRTTLDTGMRHSISTIAGYVGFGVALAVALGQAGVQVQNIALVAGALSVGIGFGLQQVVSNFVAGLIVLAERPIRVGDVVVVKGEEGKVKRISVRSTELALGERSTLIVPNADFISSIVKNRSLADPTQRIKVVLLLDHAADVKDAVAIMLETAASNRHLLAGSKPSVQINKVTELGVEVELKYVCDHLDNMDVSRTLLIYSVLEQFKAKDIRLAKA